MVPRPGTRVVWIGTVVVLVVLVALGSAFLLNRNDDGTNAADDGRAVFCMSSEHRAQLIEAASNLGLGERVDGRPEEIAVGHEHMSLRQWRTGEKTRAQFRQTCTALATALKGPAASSSSGGGTSPATTFAIGVLTALIPVAAGAWLTWVAGSRKDTVGIRRLQVENLRNAGVQFSKAAEAYVRMRASSGQAGKASLDTVEERRIELAAALRQVGAAHPGWAPPGELRGRLETELGGDFVGQVGQISEDTAGELSAKVGALADEVERLAAIHETGGPTGSATTTTQVTSGKDT